MRTVAIFGGPGSAADAAQSVTALAAAAGDIKLAGFLNDILPRGERVSGVPVLGPFASWRDLPEDVTFLAPLHRPKLMPERMRLVEGLGIPQHRWATIVDPRSAVAADAQLGHGCFVGPFATIGPASRLGAHSVVRSGAQISHDCKIGRFVFFGTNSALCGFGIVDDGAYVAPGATITDHCHIGTCAVVGLGAAVTKNVPAYAVVAGVPARPISPDACADD